MTGPDNMGRMKQGWKFQGRALGKSRKSENQLKIENAELVKQNTPLVLENGALLLAMDTIIMLGRSALSTDRRLEAILGMASKTLKEIREGRI